MAQVWFRRKGAGTSGLNNGTSRANAYQGIKKLDDVLRAGSISVSDTLEFDELSGPLDLQDRAEFAANTTAQATGINIDTQAFATTVGIMLGSGLSSTSYMSGRTINWHGSWAHPSVDMRNMTTNAQRMLAGIRIFGESITCNDLFVIPPDWPYLRTAAYPANVPGPATDAELVSDENFGILIGGNGTSCTFEVDGSLGTRAWCLSGLTYLLTNNNVANDTAGLKGTLTGKVINCFSGVEAIDFGGNANHGITKGTELLMVDITVQGCMWGVNEGMARKGYNGTKHGNGMRVRGVTRGGVTISNCSITGDFQDGVVLLGYVAMAKDLDIFDIGSGPYEHWNWNATSGRFEIVTKSTGLEGNGIKCGLGSYDNKSPTAWLGDDGTFGANQFGVDEIRSIVLRCKIRNVQALGITANQGRGMALISNEIWDAGGSGVALFSTGNGNYWLHNNLVRKFNTDPSNSALQVESSARVWLYNNIFWSNPSVSTQRDVTWNSGVLMAKDKNLLVTGRVGGTGYNTTGDIANTGDRTATAMASAWTFGSGLPAGHSLLTLGTNVPFLTCRTVGGGTNRLGNQFPTSNPPVGPY